MKKFKPYSKFPPCLKDVSFWLPPVAEEGAADLFTENNLCEVGPARYRSPSCDR